MEGIEIQLSTDTLFQHYLVDYTDSTGYYQFNNLDEGRAYFVRGFKNDDILNGVTILDMLDIQKYLLGKTRFNSYDQYIAADINHSDQVSVMDLVPLRQVMLGKQRNFPNNFSWRFITLQDTVGPFQLAQLHDFAHFTLGNYQNIELDLVGIKIGDVNRDAHID